MSYPISPLVPDERLTWRENESLQDLPQMSELINAFIRGIKPFVARKMKKKQEIEWWDHTFRTMKALAQEIQKIHSQNQKHKLGGLDFSKVRESLEAMIE